MAYNNQFFAQKSFFNGTTMPLGKDNNENYLNVTVIRLLSETLSEHKTYKNKEE